MGGCGYLKIQTNNHKVVSYGVTTWLLGCLCGFQVGVLHFLRCSMFLVLYYVVARVLLCSCYSVFDGFQCVVSHFLCVFSTLLCGC